MENAKKFLLLALIFIASTSCNGMQRPKKVIHIKPRLQSAEDIRRFLEEKERENVKACEEACESYTHLGELDLFSKADQLDSIRGIEQAAKVHAEELSRVKAHTKAIAVAVVQLRQEIALLLANQKQNLTPIVELLQASLTTQREIKEQLQVIAEGLSSRKRGPTIGRTFGGYA